MQICQKEKNALVGRAARAEIIEFFCANMQIFRLKIKS